MHEEGDRFRSALERLIVPGGREDALDQVRRGRRRALVRRNVARIGLVVAVLTLSTSSLVLLDRTLGPSAPNLSGGIPGSVTGGRIAFAAYDGNDFGIHTVNPDGSDLRHLTPGNGGEDGDPAWSPDGAQIAFQSSRSGTGDIYVMDGDGSNVLRLTDSSQSESEPTWSPDGSWIAYAVGDGSELLIRAVRPDGSETIDLVRSAEYVSTVYGMDWSPDGRSLALAAPPSRPTMAQRWRGSSLVVADLDTGVLEELYPGPVAGPSWSPDGAQILFLGNQGVRLIDASGGDAPTITEPVTGANPFPEWSPDGSRFVIGLHGYRDATGGPGLYLFTSAGEALGVIPVGDLVPHDTSWQPIPV